MRVLVLLKATSCIMYSWYHFLRIVVQVQTHKNMARGCRRHTLYVGGEMNKPLWLIWMNLSQIIAEEKERVTG